MNGSDRQGEDPVKKEDGTSAAGTALAANSPALAKLNKGEAYYGDATVFGKTYDAGYVPIKDASGCRYRSLLRRLQQVTQS